MENTNYFYPEFFLLLFYFIFFSFLSFIFYFYFFLHKKGNISITSLKSVAQIKKSQGINLMEF